jgi:MinD-like ATPase involved in chromosome partitioning or flagellar assembly
VPRAVINLAGGEGDLRVGAKLREIVQRTLGVTIDFVGFVLREAAVSRSVALRTPAVLADPDSRFASSVRQIARALIRIGDGPTIVLHEDDDMGELQQRLQAM